MSTAFQEFLRQKIEGTGWKDRKRDQMEWLGALNRLFETIRVHLSKADPDGLIEIVPYEVERVEERLGIYDASAFTIRLGTDSADILPVGRYVRLPLALRDLLALPGNEKRWGDLSGGRVDVTNGETKHWLLRSIDAGEDRWFALRSDKNVPEPFDRERLEAILQDLLK